MRRLRDSARAATARRPEFALVLVSSRQTLPEEGAGESGNSWRVCFSPVLEIFNELKAKY